MRSAERIGRTPRQYADHMAAERERLGREALATIRAARERGEEWVAWIDAGCPRLTPEEYERRQSASAKRRRR